MRSSSHYVNLHVNENENSYQTDTPDVKSCHHFALPVSSQVKTDSQTVTHSHVTKLTFIEKVSLYRPKHGALITRVSAAIFGGYLVAANVCGFIAALLPLPAVDATLVATMFAFAIYAVSAIRAFSLQSPMRACLEPLIISACLYAATQMMTQHL